MTDAYYRRLSHEVLADGSTITTYEPTVHAQGAWNPHEQHMAPASGILARELELFQHKPHLRIGRISFDIFGLIHLDQFTIETKAIRPGKTIELIEATLRAQGKICIVARAWRIVMHDTRAIMGIEDKVVTSPSELQPWDGIRIWPGGYIQSISPRAAPDRRPGKGLVWLSTDKTLVEGEQTSDFAKLMGLVDTANGIVTRQQVPFDWAFPNLDLQIHMYRIPKGSWLGLETVQQFGDDGIGLTSSILHDIHGPFGRSEQILTIRPMPPST
ncbi:thioesterase family protein [Pelistega europaea]|uniref:Thioesterase family protein n=1 Tax=Pelistega europaea TaxID=106147 RepID=A0A7Y4P5G6_9BURK|nr:thioesterase family protein [Pelistega europaea]NOL48720.1 thioesterase family protein [Pelistega europaea]